MNLKTESDRRKHPSEASVKDLSRSVKTPPFTMYPPGVFVDMEVPDEP